MDYNKQYADVAELVDALASGASASNGVKVQVLSSAPIHGFFLELSLEMAAFSILYYGSLHRITSAGRNTIKYFVEYRLVLFSGSFFRS